MDLRLGGWLVLIIKILKVGGNVGLLCIIDLVISDFIFMCGIFLNRNSYYFLYYFFKDEIVFYWKKKKFRLYFD